MVALFTNPTLIIMLLWVPCVPELQMFVWLPLIPWLPRLLLFIDCKGYVDIL